MQLEIVHGFVQPRVIEILKKIDEDDNTIKLILIVENQNPEGNYSVSVVAELRSQTDPVIEEVKLITEDIVKELTPTEKEPTKNCVNKITNSAGE